jgi:simple sugar transport system ATP-binding protein
LTYRSRKHSGPASKARLVQVLTRKQEELADEMITRHRDAELSKVVKELSGGNQQKVILARWLVSQPEFLILDEPTRGIDVGAHAEVIGIIKDLCERGMPLLVISSELGEVVDYSDRVVVLRDRKKETELQRNQISQNTIMHAIAES